VSVAGGGACPPPRAPRSCANADNENTRHDRITIVAFDFIHTPQFENPRELLIASNVVKSIG
jgi:hypothetical protein